MSERTERTSPLKVLVCSECGKQHAPKEEVWAAFHRHGDDLKPYEEVEVMPVNSPNVLSVDEATKVIRRLEDSPWSAGNELSCRLQDYAASENPESTEEGT